jgi:hypothetical protein
MERSGEASSQRSILLMVLLDQLLIPDCFGGLGVESCEKCRSVLGTMRI